MLTPSQRKKVAEAILGRTCMVYKRTVHACFYATDVGRNIPTLAWEPLNNLEQKDALVSTIAGLIEARSNWEPTIGWLLRFNKLLSENNVEGLESLAYELLEAE